MSTLNDNDLFVYEDATTGNLGAVMASNRSNLNDDDLFIVERGGTLYKVRSEDVAQNEAAIVVSPTVTGTSNYGSATLSATPASVINAGVDPNYDNWFKDGVQISNSYGLQYEATSPGEYKYQERWIGIEGDEVFPSATFTIQPSTVATPTVISPEDGAGLGELGVYSPKTGATTALSSSDDPKYLGVSNIQGTGGLGYNTGWGGGSPTEYFNYQCQNIFVLENTGKIEINVSDPALNGSVFTFKNSNNNAGSPGYSHSWYTVDTNGTQSAATEVTGSGKQSAEIPLAGINYIYIAGLSWVGDGSPSAPNAGRFEIDGIDIREYGTTTTLTFANENIYQSDTGDLVTGDSFADAFPVGTAVTGRGIRESNFSNPFYFKTNWTATSTPYYWSQATFPYTQSRSFILVRDTDNSIGRQFIIDSESNDWKSYLDPNSTDGAQEVNTVSHSSSLQSIDDRWVFGGQMNQSGTNYRAHLWRGGYALSDVRTYTGNGGNSQNIKHGLTFNQGNPLCAWIKCTSDGNTECFG